MQIHISMNMILKNGTMIVALLEQYYNKYYNWTFYTFLYIINILWIFSLLNFPLLYKNSQPNNNSCNLNGNNV